MSLVYVLTHAFVMKTSKEEELEERAKMIGVYTSEFAVDTSQPGGQTKFNNPTKDTLNGILQGTQVCDYEATLGRAIDKINAANISYFLLGPNGNSVWRYLIEQVPGILLYSNYPPPAARAFGWNIALPGVETTP